MNFTKLAIIETILNMNDKRDLECIDAYVSGLVGKKRTIRGIIDDLLDTVDEKQMSEISYMIQDYLFPPTEEDEEE